MKKYNVKCNELLPVEERLKVLNEIKALTGCGEFLDNKDALCEIISENDLTFKRPGTGIYPSRIDEVIGKIAKTDISEDTLIDFDMIG